MHYENLMVKEIKKAEDYWYVILVSDRGGNFYFPVADLNISEEKLEENGIFVGRNFLGAVANNNLIALDGFSFIKSSGMKR